MLKILKNLKKSAISVIAIIILLCVQAATDLALPTYTSRIVNIGIQQGGIEYAVPEAISKNQLDTLLLFTSDDDSILNSYEIITEDNKDYDKYLKKYPEIEKQEVYIVKDLNNEELSNLSNIMAKPLLGLSAIRNFSNTDNSQNTNSVTMENMPEEELQKLLDERTSTLSETMVEQAAIQEVKEEYKLLGADTDSIQNTFILISGLQMLGIASITMISAITIMLLSSRVAAKLGKTLREKIFKKVLSFSTEEFNGFSTASLITRTTNDIQQIQMLLTILFRVVVYAPIIAIGGIIRVIFNSDASMAWIIALAVICIVIIVLTLMIVAMPRFKILQKLVDKLNLVSREILTGSQVIRAFNTEEREEKRFDNANMDLMKTQVFVNRAMSIMMPALMLVMNCIAILIVWIGGHNVDAGIIQVGDVMAFIQYTMQIVMAFLMISMVSIMLPRASVSAERINEVLETEPKISDKEKTKSFDESKKGYVEFKDVSFHYPDADTEVVTDISFVAKPGETTALIGSTGSGKSTIVNLIPRFYDVTGGELLVDGINVKDVSQGELRKRIGFVPQKGILFSGTIESNIKYGDENITDEQMVEAARIAQAEEFIEAKPLKYQEPISQGGGNVSGGQKQRLSIARAIAINPEILVFDDSFSALDMKTDKILREELAKHTKEKTVIIVAQRISTIMNADQIIVLDEGKIVGKGTHEELLENCETYKQIALSQLSKEELENGRK